MNPSRFIVSGLLAFLPWFAAPPGVAGDRIAFVVGTDTYDHLDRGAQLDVAVSDARLIAQTLEALQPRFEVTLLTDTGVDPAKKALADFVKKARGAECALVYIAGHGVEYHGENFLLMKDTDVSEISDDVERMKRRLREKALSLQTVVDELDATRAAVKVVIVDACRNNPLRAETNDGTRSVVGSRGGLAQVTPPSGTIISYSADAGQQANDGLFTRLLVEQLKRPGQTIMETFAATRETVLRESTALAASTPPRGVRHEPAEYVKLNVAGMRFSFAAGTSAVPGPVPMVPVPVVPEKHPLLSATKDAPWVNQLGMEFVPLPGNPGVFMCRTETRVRDFRAYALATAYMQKGGAYVMKVKGYSANWEIDASASWEKPGFPQSEDHAVTCVSWEDARAFNDWLSRLDSGLTYRLPTDAEWSVAVGVGQYPWGGSFPPPKNAGNYAGSEAKIGAFKSNSFTTIVGYDDGSPRTAPVGSYGANRFGFFDLGGNVWEWTESLYKSSMNEADFLEAYPDLKKEARSDGTPHRVLRGGSWNLGSEVDLRSSCRFSVHPASRYSGTGFRCVVSSAR